MALKKCPFCAEEIQEEAIICKHCKSNLNQQTNVTHDVGQVSNSQLSSSQIIDSEQNQANQKVKTGINWSNWKSGKRLVFISCCIAIVSQFMNWVDMGIASANGIDQGTFLILVLYIYPCIALFRNFRISAIWGGICAAASIGLSIAYINSKTLELFGNETNAAGIGPYIFILASVALGTGAIIDFFQVKKQENVANEEDVVLKSLSEEDKNLIASKKHVSKKKVVVVIVIILVVIVALLTGLYVIGKNSSSITKDNTKQAEITEKATTDYGMNEDVQNGDFVLRVNEIKQLKTFTAKNTITDDSITYTAKGTFFLINVTVTNNSKQAKNIELGQFTLVDNTNAEYVSSRIYDSIDITFLDFTTTLNPDEKFSGHILFDIPVIKGDYKLKCSSTGNFEMKEGENVFINLKQVTSSFTNINHQQAKLMLEKWANGDEINSYPENDIIINGIRYMYFDCTGEGHAADTIYVDNKFGKFFINTGNHEKPIMDELSNQPPSTTNIATPPVKKIKKVKKTGGKLTREQAVKVAKDKYHKMDLHAEESGDTIVDGTLYYYVKDSEGDWTQSTMLYINSKTGQIYEDVPPKSKYEKSQPEDEFIGD